MRSIRLPRPRPAMWPSRKWRAPRFRKRRPRRLRPASSLHDAPWPRPWLQWPWRSRRRLIPCALAKCPGRSRWCPAHGGCGAPASSRRLVTLDFVNADIQDVLKALAIQSGSNILVAPGGGQGDGGAAERDAGASPGYRPSRFARLWSGRRYLRRLHAGTRSKRSSRRARGEEILFPPPVAEAPPGATAGQPAGPPKVSVVRLEARGHGRAAGRSWRPRSRLRRRIEAGRAHWR